MLTPTVMRSSRSKHLDNSSNKKGIDIHIKWAVAKGVTVKSFHEHLLMTYG